MTRLLVLLAVLLAACTPDPNLPATIDVDGTWCATRGETPLSVDLEQTQPVGKASGWSAVHGSVVWGERRAVAGNVDRRGRVVLDGQNGPAFHMEGSLVEGELRLRLVDGEGLPSDAIAFRRCQEGAP